MAEDVIVDPVLVAGVADADAHAAEIGADMRLGRAQAVMPGSAAALLHLDLEGREIELVVEDGDVGGREPVEAHRFADRLAAFVHEGRGDRKSKRMNYSQ